MKVIFDQIGTPDEEDSAFVSDKEGMEYLKIFPSRTPVDWHTKYPGASQDAVDLLRRLLTLNPYYRATLEECLSHPFLSAVRIPEKEEVDTSDLRFEFEDEKNLDEGRLRELLIDEIEYFDQI